MDVHVNKPYPKPQIKRPNIEYAKILSNSYASEVSELTAITLYTYQSLIANNQFEYYHEILAKIAIVEMHHFSLLGQTIKLLGLKPTFNAVNNNCFVSWVATNVDYTTDLKQMLETDIESETIAIDNYYKQIALINDKYIRNLLYRIIEDEKLHLQIFEKLHCDLYR